MNSARKDAGGNVEHISDGMFETAEDEKHDGEEDGGDFAGDGGGGGSHPDGDADEEVAHGPLK